MTKTMSHLEVMLDDQLCLAGIDPEDTEFYAIPGRRFRWDFAWPSKKILVEVQGAIWVKGGHSTGTGITRDAEKLNLATLAGWKILIVTAEHIKSGQALLWIQEALSQ
jgi:very-short-patch-repair endonuclease